MFHNANLSQPPLSPQLPRLPPPVLPSQWLVRLLAPPQLQLQCSGLPVLELITTLSVSHQTSPHWEDQSPPLALYWCYKMCLTTLNTLSVLWPLTVLVAVLLLRLCSTLVSCCLLTYVTMYMFTYPHTHTTITAGCVVPERPVNGDWQTFSPSMTVGPDTSLSLSCSPGYVPSEVMSSTCQSDGSWNPDTADLSCTAGMYSVWSMHMITLCVYV